MKRILVLLAAAMVGLTACEKFDTQELTGTYIYDGSSYGVTLSVTLNSGKCVRIETTAGEDVISMSTGISTSGRYPQFTYKHDACNSHFVAEDGWIMKTKFTDASRFTAVSFEGVLASEDGSLATCFENSNLQFIRQE